MLKPVYIIESSYDYKEDPFSEDWEEDYEYDDQDKAIEMFKCMSEVGDNLKYRLRKVTSETICES